MIFNDATAMDLHSLPSPDIYIATPPCQSFSAAGNHQGTTDERGRLIYHPIRVVKTLKPPPKIVVIENVLALLQRHKPVYDKLVSQLEKAGYTILNKGNPVFDTKAHGVPHSRKRVILVGVHSPSAEGLVTPLRGGPVPPLRGGPVPPLRGGPMPPLRGGPVPPLEDGFHP